MYEHEILTVPLVADYQPRLCALLDAKKNLEGADLIHAYTGVQTALITGEQMPVMFLIFRKLKVIDQ